MKSLKMMRSVIIFLIWILVVPCGINAQSRKVVCVAPLVPEQFETGGKLDRLLKRNSVTRDSLLTFINTKSIEIFKSRMKEAVLVVIDTGVLHHIYDSSEVIKMFTSTHLMKLGQSAGFKKLQAYNESGSGNYFLGRNLSPAGSAAARQELFHRQADYFIILNRLGIRYSGRAGFVMHFEVYDRELNRVYGDKYIHFLDFSGNMYHSTFLYYLNYSLEGFISFLDKRIKAGF